MKNAAVRAIGLATFALVIGMMAGNGGEARSDDDLAGDRQKAAAALALAREIVAVGVLPQKEKQALSELFIAEQALKTASQSEGSAKALAERKAVTQQQVAASSQATIQARLRVDAAQEKLRTLRETKTKVLQQFDRLETLLEELAAK